MLPRICPAVEQLEERYVPSTAVAVHPIHPAPAEIRDTQAIAAVVQAVRWHIDRIDAKLPSVIAAAMAALPPTPLSVNAPPAPPNVIPPTVLPLEMPVVTDVAFVNEALEAAHAGEPAAPAVDPVPSPPVVVVTTVEQAGEYVVAAIADRDLEPVRAPSVLLAPPVREPAAEPAAHDHLPLLVWMLGIASVVALHAERRRLVPLAG